MIKTSISADALYTQEATLSTWRAYLLQARVQSVSIPDPMATRLEEAYLEMRKCMDGIDESQFSQMLNLAKYHNIILQVLILLCRLISKTHLASELSWDHWEQALSIYKASILI